MTHKFDAHIEHFKNLRERIKDLGDTNPTEIRQDNLCGACAVASYVIFLYLVKQGYSPLFRVTDFHCWIEADGFYIDLTATQYGFKEEVLIKSKSAFEKMMVGRGDYMNSITLDNVSKLKKHVSNWTSGQNPFYLQNNSKTMKLILKLFV